MNYEVAGLSAEQEDAFGIPNDSWVEVVGFVYHTYMTMAIYVTSDGRLSEVPIWALRAVVPA